MGDRPRDFPFVQGLGEYLPFRDETFDQILFATSLDHVIDPRRCMAEAKRCVRAGGRIDVWLDVPCAQTPGSKRGRFRSLGVKGWRALAHHDWLGKLGLPRTLRYIATVARMAVPAGAVDCFHLREVGHETFEPWLAELGLRIARRETLPTTGLFLQVTGL